MASGVARALIRSRSRALEMSQFWQKRQPRLQPAVPNDSTALPGWKWCSGFFSMGSMQKPVDWPQADSTIWPSALPRTKQKARWPGASVQARGHRSQRMRPSSPSGCQKRAGTPVGGSRTWAVMATGPRRAAGQGSYVNR